MKSQYKALTFSSQNHFNKWLKNTATFKIEFQDLGQDLLTIWVDEFGEILHANAQTEIWNGQFIGLLSLSVANPVQMWGIKKKWTTMERLLVQNIEQLKTN